MNPNRAPLPAGEISRAAYGAIVPKLTRLRQEVLEVLRKYGPQTANEVVGKLPPSDLSNNNVRSRLKELRDLGLVVVNSEVNDPVSGRQARQYRAIEPGETPPPSPNALRPGRISRAQWEAEVERLRAEIVALKRRLGAGTRE